MKKSIIVFSNPFGYGPTGVAIPIINSLLEKIKDAEIIFAGSAFCLEIMSDVSIKKELINERDCDEIEKFLGKFDNPYVIGSQNRFCIKVAKKLQIPCAFIDILAWFWKEIPNDHLIADEIFWIKFPGVERRIPNENNNIHLVSGILRMPEKIICDKNNLTIHIGGAKYPPLNEIPYSYLNLLAKAINSLESDKHFSNIFFAGGLDSTDYIRTKIINKKVVFVNNDYIKRLSESIHLTTVAGVSSTLEAFSMDIPTSFLPALNLSHSALLRLLLINDCPCNYLDWNNYVEVDKRISEMCEREAIEKIKLYTKMVDEDLELSKKFIEDFTKMSYHVPDIAKQSKLIKSLGNTGGDEIIDILKDKWDF